jgi:Domain of unknown function (DUF5011)
MVGCKHNRTKLIVHSKHKTMKLINKISITFLLALFVLAGCKKDTTADVSKAVKVSYPAIALNGNALVTLAVGATYTDAGAKLTDDITGAVSDIQPTSSNVNTATPGLYVVTFSASNSNGFETSASRLVAVSSVNNPIDRSGTYLRTATGVNCYITKIAPGVYKVTNPGGAGVGANTIVYMVETALNVYTAPPQPTDAGTFSVININFTATGATWNVVNAGYGTGQRVFVKQ